MTATTQRRFALLAAVVVVCAECGEPDVSAELFPPLDPFQLDGSQAGTVFTDNGTKTLWATCEPEPDCWLSVAYDGGGFNVRCVLDLRSWAEVECGPGDVWTLAGSQPVCVYGGACWR